MSLLTVSMGREYNERYNVGVHLEGQAMTALKLTQIGNSVGVILPKEVLARLKLEKGDTVFVTEAANGVTLTPYDPALDEQLKAGREFMREFRDTFHQLAK
jgi:putative addiction module antidote